MSETTLSADDRLSIFDTFLRIGAGIDAADAQLLASAFADRATFDFGPAARFAGIDFPILEGRAAIVEGLIGSVGQLDTIHQATNPRYAVDGDRVTLSTIVEAAHFPPGDHSRHLTQKNRHTTVLERNGDGWLVLSNVVDGAAVDGDIRVLTGQA